MSIQKHIYILRHGETDFNRNGVVQGSGVDSSLNETGRRQARAFYEKYRDVPFELLICSTLQRSFQTIEPFLQHQIPLERHPGINEINWGIHEGKKSDEGLIRNYRMITDAWGRGDFKKAVEKGESAELLARRVESFLEDLTSRTEEKILVCSHGRTLRCMMCLLKGESIQHMDRYTHDNTGLNIIRFGSGRFIVDTHNDTSHLQEHQTI